MKKNLFTIMIIAVIATITLTVFYVRKKSESADGSIVHEIAVAIDKQETVCGTVIIIPRLVTIQKGQSLCSALGIDSVEASRIAHYYKMDIGSDTKGRENPLVHVGDEFIKVPLPNGDSAWAPNLPQFYDWSDEDEIAKNK